MNADPAVMEFFPSVMDADQSRAAFDRIEDHWARYGFGLNAVDGPDGFIGFVGLAVPSFDVPFPHLADPCVEIGWRLVSSAWGHGYASEAARAVVGQAFGALGLPELVSFTSVVNGRSRAVMERLGMQRDPSEDFDHPRVPEGSRLRRHVLYRLTRAEGPAH
jgi:RimJ/RimL family protein N-acetyltransferase